MARRVFFSFHYKRDIFRVNVVRNSWVVRGVEETGYWDSSIWGNAKLRGGDEALRTLIREGLVGTSVTAVLIGKETYQRRWVHYEIEQSRKCGNGLIGIRIHNVKVPQTLAGALAGGNELGPNPFDWHTMSGRRQNLLTAGATASDPPISLHVPVYDWVQHDGYQNIGTWVEAASQRGHLTKL